MPEIIVELSSRSGRPVMDEPQDVRVTGSHYVHRRDIETDKGCLMVDCVPGRYTASLSLPGYKNLSVKFRAQARVPRRVLGKIDPRAVALPSYAQLNAEQKRLFDSHQDGKKKAWRRLSDNQAATFFQVSHALSHTEADNKPLSAYIHRVQVIGGAEIERRHDGELRRAVGWRMHVLFKRYVRDRMADVLLRSGFARDRSPTHPTHTKFGYTVSFRQTGGDPKLQLVLNESAPGVYRGADIDLDVGSFHQSSPARVYPRLAARYDGVGQIFRVV